MVVLSICFLIHSDPAGVLDTMIDASADAFKLSIELCAIYAVWLGILELVDASGLSEKLAHLLSANAKSPAQVTEFLDAQTV